MLSNLTYKELREKIDVLNTDLSHFVNSNDISTPMDCVEEMVDKIPSEFWDRDFVKILDPCAGNGNFPAYLCEKIKNNVFLQINEINEKRIAYLKEFFKESKSLKITEEDFLTFQDCPIYDLVIANPPYALFNKEGRTAKNHSIFKEFVKKGLGVLKENGYLIFIIPDSWMSLSDRNDLPILLSEYQFIYLNIHGAKKYFRSVGSSFTWFILKKTENKEKFLIDNFYNKEELSLCSLNRGTENIPLFYNSFVKSIVDKTLNKENTKIEIETTSDLHKYTKKSFLSAVKDEKFKYEIIHTQSQKVFSKRPHKYQEGWKVFISLTSYYSTFIKNNAGMTQSIAFVRVASKEEAEKIKKILDHPLFVFLNNIHRYGNFNNIRILQKFPLPSKEDIWKEFNITEEEKEFILEFLGQ